MSYIQETVEELKLRIGKAKGEIAVLEKCVALLTELAEEPGQQETPPDNSHEDEPIAAVKKTRSGTLGVYQVGAGSKKWYAAVTEKGKTKRLPRTYDTVEEAATARWEYLAKRDNKECPKQSVTRTFGPSNDATV